MHAVQPPIESSPARPSRPKVHQRPNFTAIRPLAAPGKSESANSEPARKSAWEWNLPFAIGLIALLVIVNGTLALLLGGSSDRPAPVQKQPVAAITEATPTTTDTSDPITSVTRPAVQAVDSSELLAIIRGEAE